MHVGDAAFGLDFAVANPKAGVIAKEQAVRFFAVDLAFGVRDALDHRVNSDLSGTPGTCRSLNFEEENQGSK